jgi:restriction system protein
MELDPHLCRIRHKRCSPFIGRKRQLEEIARFLDKSRFHGEPVLKIIGPPGSGKTALVHEVARRQPRLTPIWVRFDQKLQNPAEFSRNYLDHVLHRDGERNSKERELESVLVVLDAVEAASESVLTDWLRAIFNYKRVAGLILTSRDHIPIRGEEFFLKGMSSDEARDFLKQQLDESIGTQDIDALIKKAAGFPAALSLISELLRHHPKDKILSAIDGQVYALKKADESKIIQAVRPQIITFSGELVHQLTKTPEKIYDVSSRQFEQLIADLFNDMGWEVELTKATRDGGRDILAHLNTGTMKLLCLIEAKKHRKDRPVGVQLVRNLYGTFCDEQANSAMLVTTSYFSEDAKTFRDKHKYQLTLKDYADVVGWLADYKNQKTGRKQADSDPRLQLRCLGINKL